MLAVGPLHVAVALNNRALFWDLSTYQYDINTHFERDYLATVDSISLNETYVSVLFDGKLQLQLVYTYIYIVNFYYECNLIK